MLPSCPTWPWSPVTCPPDMHPGSIIPRAAVPSVDRFASPCHSKKSSRCKNQMSQVHIFFVWETWTSHLPSLNFSLLIWKIGITKRDWQNYCEDKIVRWNSLAKWLIEPCKSVNWYFQTYYLLPSILHLLKSRNTHPSALPMTRCLAAPTQRLASPALPVTGHQHSGSPSCQPSRHFTRELLLWSYILPES